MRIEFWLMFLFGLFFLVTRLVLAVRFPNPTRDQQAVFRTVLALSAAGIAVVIPGFLDLKSQFEAATVSATGALSVFVFVYLFNPGSLRGVNETASAPEDSRIDEIAQSVDELSHTMQRILDQIAVLERRLGESEEQQQMAEAAASVELEHSKIDLEKVPSERIGSNLVEFRSSLAMLLVGGIAVVLFLFVIALALPAPTAFQASVLRTGFALAAAGFGAFVPGILQVQSRGVLFALRFVSSAVLFVLFFFLNPAALPWPEPVLVNPDLLILQESTTR